MATSDLVVDASVVVKWFVAEAGSDAARGILASDRTLLAPAHGLAETAEVLARYRRSGKIGEAQQRRIASILPAVLAAVPIGDLLPAALDMAWRARISAYDALYVAAAERLETVVVTADLRLMERLADSPWSSRATALDQWASRDADA